MHALAINEPHLHEKIALSKCYSNSPTEQQARKTSPSSSDPRVCILTFPDQERLPTQMLVLQCSKQETSTSRNDRYLTYRYNAMKCQLQSMSGTLLGIHAGKCQLQSNILPTTKCQLHAVNKCRVSYLEMLGTYSIAGIHETVRY